MDTLKTTLLIGNGLNQCLNGGIPWGNLLAQIAEQFNISSRDDIPMPLEFERLVNTYLQNNAWDTKDIYNRVKNTVANLVSAAILPPNSIHNEITKLKVDSIITTNYDLLLEQAFEPSFSPAIHKGVAGTQTKYLRTSVGHIGSVSFYHAHGCVAAPSTICLGYEHYMGNVEKMRNELNRTPKELGRKNIIAVLDGGIQPSNTWMEKFYTDNIGIIGFGLYDCESDFWWLLTHRASLYYTDERGQHSYIKNRITYYDVIDDIPRTDEREHAKMVAKIKETERKHHLLEGLHVRVKKYYISELESNTYTEAYMKIIAEIKEAWV